MPEHPGSKVHVHPFRSGHGLVGRAAPEAGPAYAELMVTSNFTFLTGASHPDELAQQAASLGHAAIAITDVNTLAGVVRGHVAAKQAGIPFIVGCRLVLSDPGRPEVLVYPADLASYGRLCQLLTLGRRRAPKGQCQLFLQDLLEHHSGLLAVAIPPAPEFMTSPEKSQAFIHCLRQLRDTFDEDRLSLAATQLLTGEDRATLADLLALGSELGIPLVAVNDVHYHTPARQPLQDVLTCIRLGCTLDDAGLQLFPHAERCLRPPHAMASLFAAHPAALRRTLEIAQRATKFSLDQLRYEYPTECSPPGVTPMEHLTALSWEGAKQRYPQGVPAKVRGQIEHELALIEELRYAQYFLTVRDIVQFANARGILCQGRGAAANSAVCYCLGITAVDPDRINVLFERFISRERNEPPDIDIDFEHERREEVIQHLYATFGRDRAALTAEVITYRGRSAIREVGKALGLSLDAVDQVARNLDWFDEGHMPATRLRSMGLDPSNPTIQHWLRLSQEIQGFPRHLSQHVGGFVITQKPLCQLVPIENAAMADRTVIQWDKDDIDALGMLKVDILGLGMLTCIRKGFELIQQHEHQQLTLANVPAEDASVYDMVCQADTVGVFQIESRAQMSMLPRLRPRCFYDLVIEVAIVRPGPIQGQMVHPYLRRRTGEEPVSYPSVQVESVLRKTLGVPLFQEQVMSLAIVAAGFTPGEADQLRRAIAAWKSRGHNRLMDFQKRFIEGMLARGYPPAFAEQCFNQIKGFGDYGFPESHAASFALLVYVSAYLKKHHPAAFACALLNSQPMGFYAPAQIVRDAAAHGVAIRPVDIQHSQWDCTLEPTGNTASPLALRLGMRMVRGLRQTDALRITHSVRQHGSFATPLQLWRASGVSVHSLRKLAQGDAYASMGLDRQAALWEVRTLRDQSLPLFDMPAGDVPADPAAASPADANTPLEQPWAPTALPAVSAVRKVVQDYRTVGLSLRSHPLAFLRDRLSRLRIVPASSLADAAKTPTGARVAVAGIVLVRQRPSTASGIIFMTLEDETGVANLIVRPHIFQRFRRTARHGVVIVARGHVERQGAVVHVLVKDFKDLTEEFSDLLASARDFR